MEAVLYGSIEVNAHEGSHVYYSEGDDRVEGNGFFSDWDDLTMKDQATIIELRGEAMSAVKKLGDFLKSLGESVPLAA